MRRQIHSPKGKDGFPDSPVPASDLLIPITCWSGMVCESRITGVEFDDFWYESIKDGVCYFFRWLGKPRSTVLVIFDEESPDHIECRTLGDRLVPQMEAEPILAEVVRRFQAAGFWSITPVIDEKVYPVEDDSSIDDQYHCFRRATGHQQAGAIVRNSQRAACDDGADMHEIEAQLEGYEDPDYSEAEDRFSDPVAEIVSARKSAQQAGLTDESIKLLWPFPK